MGAYLHVPVSMLNMETIKFIVSDLSIEINIDEIAQGLDLSIDDPSLVEHCIDAIEDVTDMDLWNDKGIFSITDSELDDEERLVNIENHLTDKRIPFDSTQADGLCMFKYRPHISDELLDQLDHPHVDGPVIPAKFILDLIDTASTANVDTFKKVLLKNIEEHINSVPHIKSYATESNLHFQATGLRDLRLLA